MGKYLAISVPLLVGVLFVVQRYYLGTSRQVRLLDIEAKAPVYTHFLESLKGVTTIRAYRWQGGFEDRNAELLNASQKPHYVLACVQLWLALVLDLVVGALALIIVATATSLADDDAFFSPGAVGVALVLVLGFNTSLAMTMKNWTALETSIGAVARVREFAETTPSEEEEGARHLGRGGAPPSGWPLRGAITFENATARYAEDGEATLKGLSLSISPGQKVAVCGPSGSGKTSLVLSLLQMIEVTDGRVLVDGVDLAGLGKAEVRSRITVVPQEPFFMPGTVRFNLDPYSRASDNDLEAALDKVGLLGKVGMAGGLDADLDADGFSAGERQLLALTRALISKSQILILDEATSRLGRLLPRLGMFEFRCVLRSIELINYTVLPSVDQDTEAKMQSIVESEFSQQTVVAVVHRLRYIEQYDKVLLLKRGEVVRWGSPKELLEKDAEFRGFAEAMQISH
ncbi:Multidrug resistance-associated protein 1 [Colletotrichum tanaceti]|nr:Multidrug resistance-associated protein 1 [Colletotrichum tanaceti]